MAKARQDAADVAARMRVVSLWCQWHRLDNGLWFEVRLAPDGARCRPVSAALLSYGEERDVVLTAGLSRLSRLELYRRCGVFAVAKRQLSRRELRKAGIR